MKNKIVAGVLFAIVFFFSLRYVTYVGVSALGVVSSSILYPFVRAHSIVVEPVQQWLKEKRKVYELQGEVDELRGERERLLAENIALKSAALYFRDIRELVDFNRRYGLSHGRIAHVLARYFSAYNQFFLLDAGSAHGIKKDMIAVWCNALVGKVVEVYPWYCKVCLITDAECKVAAVCAKTGASGIHEGVNERDRTYVKHMSHLQTIELNDTVLSSGDGLIFPMGFALGTITAVQRGEIFYEVTIKPCVDFQSLQYCTLIAKEDTSAALGV